MTTVIHHFIRCMLLMQFCCCFFAVGGNKGEKSEAVASSFDEPPNPAFGNSIQPSPAHSALARFQFEAAGSSQKKTFQILHAAEEAQVIQQRCMTCMHNFECCIKSIKKSLSHQFANGE